MQAAAYFSRSVRLARWAHAITAAVGNAQGEPITLGDDHWGHATHADLCRSLHKGEASGVPQGVYDGFPGQSVPGVYRMLGTALAG